MDSKMMLLLGVVLLSGWGSVCVAGFGDDQVPLLHDYHDGNSLQFNQEQAPLAYQSCPAFGVFQPGEQLSPAAYFFSQVPDYLEGNGSFGNVAPGYVLASDFKMKQQDSVLAPLQQYFIGQPAIETEKLVLCPLGVEHAQALAPLFGAYTKEFFAALVAQRLTGSVVPWVVYLKGSNDTPGQVIGYCGFDAVTDRNEGLIVCEFLQEFCSKGNYFEQAMFVILSEGFSYLGFDKIILDKRSNVSGAQRVRDIGFTSTMLYDRCAGKYAEIRRFAITRDQYYKLDVQSQEMLRVSAYEVENSKKMVCDDQTSVGKEISLSGDQKQNAFVKWIKNLFASSPREPGYEKITNQ